jgi:hypothetical protein
MKTLITAIAIAFVANAAQAQSLIWGPGNSPHTYGSGAYYSGPLSPQKPIACPSWVARETCLAVYEPHQAKPRAAKPGARRR